MFTYLLIINAVSYALMWIDKLKSIYQWWRVSEKTLWILVLAGGVFGIWFGMMAPLYHKAGKKSFRMVVLILALIWGVALLVFFQDKQLFALENKVIRMWVF